MTKFLRHTAWVATIAIYFLVALGGTILATHSGLNCTAWPFCSGHTASTALYQFTGQLPPFTPATAGMLGALLVIGAGIIVGARKQRGRALLTLAVCAPILLGLQTIIGGVTALWQLPVQIIAALAIFAVVITVTLLMSKPVALAEHPARTRKFAQLAITNTLCVYVLMLLGSYMSVEQRESGLFAQRFRLCRWSADALDRCGCPAPLADRSTPGAHRIAQWTPFRSSGYRWRFDRAGAHFGSGRGTPSGPGYRRVVCAGAAGRAGF